MPRPPDQTVIAEASRRIHDGFVRYNEDFRRITERARQRFEQRDWRGQIRDIAERVELYEQWASRVEQALTQSLGERIREHALWGGIRQYFGLRVDGVPDAGFMKTFFNSITRRIFGTVGVDPTVEFVQPPPEEGVQSLVMRRYPCWDSIEDACRSILDEFRFDTPYTDLERDVAFVAAEVRAYLDLYGIAGDAIRRFEFIDSHFFQGTRAYLVGRVRHDRGFQPIVIALRNSDQGVDTDAVLMQPEQVSVAFSYTRSYYFADPTSVVAAVQFLHTLLPDKPIDELYTVLGRLRQGKTERYRVFMDHLARTDDQFIHAPGDAGLVMIVFTLPSYNLVFKVMRDIFGAPKSGMSHADVDHKYRLVSRHDHAGRLIDTQHFRNLELPVARFAPELLAELTREAARTVTVVDDQVVLRNAYVERRVRPLNLHIREVDTGEAERAILDYGQCLKDLAETNIFAGDLLLKNFGVTDTGRVVFYDYDEVALITECSFRELPDAGDDYMMDPGSMAVYAATDIFPEEFIRFLSLPEPLRRVLLARHGDLLAPDFWRQVKRRHQRGEIAEVVPYARQTVPTARAPGAGTGHPAGHATVEPRPAAHDTR